MLVPGAVLVAVAAWAVGCGNSSSPTGTAEVIDARCETLCIIRVPALEGAFDVCSEKSADACRRECSASFVDLTPLCATCLLEDACFDTDCGPKLAMAEPCDPDGLCRITGREGECTYPQGDLSARNSCLRNVFPRREIDCEADYPGFDRCAGICAASQ